MDRQKLFSAAKAHSIKQPHKSFLPEGFYAKEQENTCAYRSPEGLKCFLGGIIPDSLYVPAMEGQTAMEAMFHTNELDAYMQQTYGEVDRNDEDFLTELQNIHDEWDIEDWPEGLAALAEKYNLLNV